MKRSTLISLLIALTVLGLVDAWYLANTALTGGELVCDINGLNDCNVVAQSPYAHFFGIPLGVYGVVFYGLFLLVTFLTLIRPSRGLDRIIAALSVVGVLASAYFVYVQLALIDALCIYCLASAAIAVLLAVVAYGLIRGNSPPLPPTS